MRESGFHAPDEAAMERLLAAHPRDRAGVALRLAWRAGLTRDELAALTWRQTEDALLRLPGREVPLDGETAECLRAWRQTQKRARERVLGLAPQSLSRLARRTLDEAGLTDVRLLDLRLDCARRLLQTHDWQYVLRVTGFSLSTYRQTLARFAPPEPLDAAPRDRAEDELKLWKLLQAERATAAGLALWLARYAGLSAAECAALTWEQVDLDAPAVRLSRAEAPMPQSLCAVLAEERARRAPSDDPHVLLTARTRRPMDASRVLALTRQALVRAGLTGVTLGDVRCMEEREAAERRVLDAARQNGWVSRGDVSAALGVSAGEAYRRLSALAERGRLVRVGVRYYPSGEVVPPERQREAIRDYIARYGAAYRQDIAALLGLAPRAAARILKAMVDSGELARSRGSRLYSLPEEEP